MVNLKKRLGIDGWNDLFPLCCAPPGAAKRRLGELLKYSSPRPGQTGTMFPAPPQGILAEPGDDLYIYTRCSKRGPKGPLFSRDASTLRRFDASMLRERGG